MDQLIKENIFSPADLQGEFCSNLNCVPKPSGDKITLGKADLHIDRLRGVVRNNQRICIDLRGLNSCMPAEGKLTLPPYKDLSKQFANCHCSQWDMTSMYWAIPLNYSSQFKTNFWYVKRIYKMNRLVMGQKNACYIGQRAALLTYYDDNLVAFLKEKGIDKNSSLFPFETVSDFLLVYLDDLVIWSSKKIPNSTKVHLLLVEFLLWCTIKLGFKFSKVSNFLRPKYI